MKNKIFILAVLYFAGAGVGLYLLMRSMRGNDVPTLSIVVTVFVFAAFVGWVGSK